MNFPKLSRVYSGMVASNLVSVQPMSAPLGRLFYIDNYIPLKEGETRISQDLRSLRGYAIVERLLNSKIEYNIIDSNGILILKEWVIFSGVLDYV
jgi:hypothetical protein